MDANTLKEITNPNKNKQALLLYRAINNSRKNNQDKHVEIISASIITIQVLLNYLTDLKGMKSPLFKKEIKYYTNLLLPHLIKAEEDEFDKIYKENEWFTHMITTNLSEGMSFISKNGFSNMLLHMKLEKVNKCCPEKIEDFIDKLMKENGLAIEQKGFKE